MKTVALTKPVDNRSAGTASLFNILWRICTGVRLCEAFSEEPRVYVSPRQAHGHRCPVARCLLDWSPTSPLPRQEPRQTG